MRHMAPAALYVAVYLAYLATAWIGLNIHPTNTFATMIWPPIGIALVVLTMYGYWLALPIGLAAFTVNLLLGAGPFTALSIAIGNTLAPLLGAYVLRDYIGFKPPNIRLRDNIGIIVIGLAASLVSSAIGILSLWLGGDIRLGMLWSTWLTWWVGDTLGILIFAPLLFKWLYWPLSEKTRFEQFERWAALSAVVGVCFLVFWVSEDAFAYCIFIPLTWVALRIGPRSTTLAIFLSASIAISGTLSGYGPYAHQGLIYVQIFIGTMSALFLIFAAVVEERRLTLRKFETQIEELEHALRRISTEDEAKREFLAILAHELRNPLATVLSSVELLKLQGVDTLEAPKRLRTMEEHVHVVADLLDDLLRISRISNKEFELQKELVAIKAAKSAQQQEFVAPQIQWTETLASASTPVSGDRKGLTRILIVDDNEDAAYGLGKLLTLRGNTVETAYTGDQAIEKAAEFAPDVVVLDIGLPDIDGYAVARKLREDNFKGILVALTGYGQASDKERAGDAGFDFHLTKPIGFKEIEVVLRKVPPRAANPE